MVKNQVSFIRMFISSTLDRRFYKEPENPMLEAAGMQRHSAGIVVQRTKTKIMRDPYEFINFFKQHVQLEI
jgi:hypothetical protein